MNNKNSNVIYFMVALLILVLTGYLIYKIFLNINNPLEENTRVPITNNKEVINELGSDKHSFLSSKKSTSNRLPIFFKDTEVNISNIDVKDVLAIAYNSLSTEDKNGVGENSNECANSSTLEDYPENCYKETIDIKILEDKIKSIFGSNYNINYQDFNATLSIYCQLNNNNYVCYYHKSDFTSPDYNILLAYKNSEIINNNLVVYSYLISVNNKSNGGVYSDVNLSNYIDDLEYYKSATTNGLTAESSKEIVNHYSASATQYKSTFIKDNNNYVWSKTELVS